SFPPPIRHSRAGGNPGQHSAAPPWVPACAGMTEGGVRRGRGRGAARGGWRVRGRAAGTRAALRERRAGQGGGSKAGCPGPAEWQGRGDASELAPVCAPLLLPLSSCPPSSCPPSIHHFLLLFVIPAKAGTQGNTALHRPGSPPSRG